QAFEGLRLKNRELRRPDLTFATMDHNVPTLNRGKINDPTARLQVETLEANCEEYGVELADINHPEQGIVHIIGPELGLTQPGKTIVCGDSHTSTTELLEHLPLVLERVKLSTFLQHKHYGKKNHKL